MEEFTLEDLRRTLRECAGEDEQVSQGGDLLDRTFSELGYDSIAFMTTTSKIELELDVRLPEGEVEFTDTLRDYLAFVNARLAAQVRGSR
jgi:act minimal PKS acyl carrier protein